MTGICFPCFHAARSFTRSPTPPPMPPFTVQPTPNPNSLKFTTSGRPFIEQGMGAFASAAEAEGDPLGDPLFAVPGVMNVLVLPPFVTVTKRPEADWNDVLPAVERILTAHLES